MKKRQTILILFILVFGTFHVNPSLWYNKNVSYITTRWLQQPRQLPENAAFEEKKSDKKLVKKLIQQRKKLQKNLLQSYNTSFDPSVLEQISQNGIQIDALTKYIS